MAFAANNRFLKHLHANVDPDPEASNEPHNHHDGDDGEKSYGVLGWLSHEVFRKDCLDRKLERHHMTGRSQSSKV